MTKATQDRLKVLHVIGGVGPGGAETLMYRVATQSSDFDHEVICLDGKDWYSDSLAEHGVTVHYLHMSSPGRALRGLWRMMRLIWDSDADVIQGWMYRSNLLAGLFARRRGIPVVWGIHNSSLEPLGFGARLWVYASGSLARWLPSHVVNCSSRSAELHTRLGFERAPVSVIHNGYDPAQFYPDKRAREQTRQILGVEAATFLVGSVARWHRQKDIPNLFRAVRLAADRGVPIQCLLMGHELDAANGELSDLIRSERVEDLVRPLGRRRDIADLARALDLHVLASLGGEAFPNSVAETMLSGTPGAVTDVGDCRYLVGESGWTVPPRDPDALASAICDAYALWRTDPESWQRRSAAARRRIADNFSMHGMIAAYADIWRAAIERRGR